MSLNLLLKIVVAPLLIAGATTVGRRWGETLSGWLVGLPFTSGPVVFFLALDQGTRFAASASLGVVLGVASQAVFALAYLYLGGRRGWLAAVVAGTFAYAALTAMLEVVQLPAQLDVVLVAASLAVAIWLIPAQPDADAIPQSRGFDDLPVRMIVGTALVLGLTAIAPTLGPRLSGLLSPFPVYAGILAVFAHRRGGFFAAARVWRGLQFGLFAFLGFFSVLAAAVVPLGIAISFGLAILTALLIEGATLVFLRSAIA